MIFFNALYWEEGGGFDLQRPANVLTSAKNMQAVAGEREGRGLRSANELTRLARCCDASDL